MVGQVRSMISLFSAHLRIRTKLEYFEFENNSVVVGDYGCDIKPPHLITPLYTIIIKILRNYYYYKTLK